MDASGDWGCVEGRVEEGLVELRVGECSIISGFDGRMEAIAACAQLVWVEGSLLGTWLTIVPACRKKLYKDGRKGIAIVQAFFRHRLRPIARQKD